MTERAARLRPDALSCDQARVYEHITGGPRSKGPRAFDSSGIPLHNDNQTVVKERIFLDKSDRDLLHNQVTVTDNALTRPWTVSKRYRREPDRQPFWREVNCAENNNHVEIGKENYMLSADGLLMPTRKDQPAPDLRYFVQSKK